jgi:hypothetical protein
MKKQKKSNRKLIQTMAQELRRFRQDEEQVSRRLRDLEAARRWMFSIPDATELLFVTMRTGVRPSSLVGQRKRLPESVGVIKEKGRRVVPRSELRRALEGKLTETWSQSWFSS